MADFNFFKRNKKKKDKSLQVEPVNDMMSKPANPNAWTSGYPYFYSPILRLPFQGEKTPGEMGAAKDYILQYPYLRVRSWQSFLESEVTQTIIKRFDLWTIGNGLKCHPEPESFILENEGIKIDPKNFAKTIESRFKVWSNSRYSDYTTNTNLNVLASEAFKHAKIGGDVLVVLRTDGMYVNMQLIDGHHCVSPFKSDPLWKDAADRGTIIENGVEITKSGQHVAYYIQNSDLKFERIERYGKNGKLMAYLVYGSKYRIGVTRGVPLLVAVLETLRKLDRYKEATVGGAEERAKIAFSIEHGMNSTGENPYLANLNQAKNLGMGEAPESKTTDIYEDTSTKVANTTGKQVVNMPNDSKLVMHESKQELTFKEFYETNVHSICAAVGIPYEVAMMRFDSNYSASRAAIKDWEHSLHVERKTFAEQFYKPFYELWFEMEILNNKVQAPGYIQARIKNEITILESYNQCRWIGVSTPHIDPVKEVQAVRMKLGDDITPLTTYAKATEQLSEGDFSQNMLRIENEKTLIPELEEPEEPVLPKGGKVGKPPKPEA